MAKYGGVISHVPIFHITQPLDSMIGINGLFYGYYKVMSNIPKIHSGSTIQVSTDVIQVQDGNKEHTNVFHRHASVQIFETSEIHKTVHLR